MRDVVKKRTKAVEKAIGRQDIVAGSVMFSVLTWYVI